MQHILVGNESKKENEVRQSLEAQLNADEVLLAYTVGSILGLTGLTSQSYYIGLTAERLIFVPVKRGAPIGQVYSIRRELVQSLKRSGGIWRRLLIELREDSLDLRVSGIRWRQRAGELIGVAAETAPTTTSDAAPTRQDRLQQARHLQGLDLIAPARTELEMAVAAELALSADPAVVSQKAQLAEATRALRVAAGFLFANIGVFFLAADVFQVCTRIIPIVVTLWLGSSLWRGKTRRRGLAILLATLGSLFYSVFLLMGGMFVDAIMAIAFYGALILVLTGESNRRRTRTAIAVFVIGYAGPLVLFTLVAAVGALMASP